MDKKEFSVFAMALKTYYPRENLLPNQQAMELWFRKLQDIPMPVAEATLDKWVSTNKWSPSIAEFREMAADVSIGDIPDWGTGWQQVCDAMRKYGREYPRSSYDSMHPLVAKTAQQLGSWWDLCTSSNPDTDRANFRMCYEIMVKREKVDRQMSLPLRETIGQLQANRMLQLESGNEGGYAGD